MLHILGIPTTLGCNVQGCNLAPQEIRTHHLRNALETTGLPLNDLGDIPIDSLTPPQRNPKAKNLDAILDLTERTIQTVQHNLAEQDILLNIGGDHSMAISTIFTTASRIPEDVFLIWIDAHGDLNSPETTPTGNVHGMPLSTVLGDSLYQYLNSYKAIKKENVVLLGIKDLDPAEWDYIHANNITSFSIDDIVEQGIGPIWKQIQMKIGKKPLHVSMDIDGLDNEVAPGTGMVNRGGINYREIKYLARQIAKQNVVALDIAEINPLHDVDGKTLDLAVELAADYFGGKFEEYERYLMRQKQ